MLSFLGFYLHDFVVGVGRKKCRVGWTDRNAVLILAGHLVVVLPLLKHQSCFLLEQVVVLDSSLIQRLHLRLYLLLHLQLSLVQLLLQQLRWILYQNVLVHLVRLRRVSVVNYFQLLLNFLLVIRTLLEVIYRPSSRVVTMQLRKLLLNDPTLLVPLVLIRVLAPHHHQILHHWTVLCLFPFLQVSAEVLYKLGHLGWRGSVLEGLNGFG